jgi:hypothetical protein
MWLHVINQEKSMKEKDAVGEQRILARKLARVLTQEEVALVAGRQAPPTQTSTCSGSDNNSCDLDNWNTH